MMETITQQLHAELDRAARMQAEINAQAEAIKALQDERTAKVEKLLNKNPFRPGDKRNHLYVQKLLSALRQNE
ncbi:MAG: hypothetical protein AAF975_00595 [Spirochaetota bacterium]